MKRITIKVKRDLPLADGAALLRCVQDVIELRPAAFLAELRFHRDPAGVLTLAAVTTHETVDAIPAAESDAAWARHQPPAVIPSPRVVTTSGLDQPLIYREGSLRDRLAAKRQRERQTVE